ncbi:hypothetical protein [Devosia sp. Root105]|uniref:hypothetical protein n=1 Tax=Devosia sp. Root105 TaxID=1736423 RepID=UPI0006FB9E1D|nr:hypothetical protein [Devosia sp. Root105]KQU96437.1 hypothetical protein ASC68_13745 [Devosia sp. Root105]
MSQKTPPDGDDTRLVAIIHQETMKKIEELAEQLGIEPLDVVVELIRLEASKRPEGVTLH